MKIFSSFDTGFKKERLKFYRNQYGKENVLLLSASGLFLRLKIIIPLLISILFLTISIGSIIHFRGENYGWMIGIFLIIVVFIGKDIYTLSRIIDYVMDFCIITPEEVVLVQQEGIFRRTVKTLDTLKIKSIYINKDTVIESIFDNGTIIFMSDGNEQLGEIVFDYIADPETAKDKIHTILAPTLHSSEHRNATHI